MKLSMNDEELKAMRSLVMQRTQQLIKLLAIEYNKARIIAMEEMAESMGVTYDELNEFWINDLQCRNLKARKIKSQTKARPMDFVDEEPDRMVFYDDYSDSSPKKDLIILADRLKPMKVGGVKSCLFDKIEEASSTRKMVSKAVKQLGWKNSRANPGYIAEVIAAGKKFKLRVERLR